MNKCYEAGVTDRAEYHGGFRSSLDVDWMHILMGALDFAASITAAEMQLKIYSTSTRKNETFFKLSSSRAN